MRHSTTQVMGPTLVYSREAMQWQTDGAVADHDIKEWIDEQAASVAKWPVPILSVTRLEWLPEVDSDLFILQTPSHLETQHITYIMDLIRAGHPVAIFGSPDGGIDPELERLTGLSGTAVPEPNPIRECRATVTLAGETLAKSIPASFDTLYRSTRNRISAGASVIYSVEGSPALVINRTSGKQVVIWDPPELIRVKDKPTGVPLAQIWRNTGAPYALAAGALNSLLKGDNVLHAAEIELNQTMNVAAWRTRDGVVSILAGNLEEGLRDDADMSRHAALVLPDSWGVTWEDSWTGRVIRTDSRKLHIDLSQAASVLLRGSGN